MYTKWTAHLVDLKDKQSFYAQVQRSKDVLDRLKDLLDEKQKEHDSMELNLEIYNQPNWAERQAHLNGYKSCLRSLRKLIDLDQQIRPKETQ